MIWQIDSYAGVGLSSADNNNNNIVVLVTAKVRFGDKLWTHSAQHTAGVGNFQIPKYLHIVYAKLS